MSMRLLLVDDSGMSRKLTRRALPAEWSLEVREAAGGEEGLALLREGGVDVVLLDLSMPGLNGFDVLRAMRHEGLDAPVVVVSADIQPGARAEALALGAAAFLRKPVEPDALRETLTGMGRT